MPVELKRFRSLFPAAIARVHFSRCLSFFAGSSADQKKPPKCADQKAWNDYQEQCHSGIETMPTCFVGDVQGMHPTRLQEEVLTKAREPLR